MSVLVVVAHPDDEVLGCGATGAALADAGTAVRACILAGRAEARMARPAEHDLHDDILAAQKVLGFAEPILGKFPNIQLNTVPHIELVEFIEAAIVSTSADIVFTHHPGDVNDDHVKVSHACQAAARLFQRRAGVPPLRRLFFMEVLSATDWAFRGNAPTFVPDAFVGIKGQLERKCEALRRYRGVMRPFPHPRSEEIIRGLAAYRGGQAGIEFAEAFQSVFANLTAKCLLAR